MPLRPSTVHRLSAALLLAAATALGACDNTLDPFVDEASEYFAVFGYLDSAADTQFVRVEPIRATAEPSEEPLRAVVTTRDPQTGTTVTWRDSLVTLDDGTTGDLFFAPGMDVEAGHLYELTVQRTDGATTRALTRVPFAPTAVVGQVDLVGITYVQSVTWRNVPYLPDRVIVYYRVATSPGDPPREFSYRYTLRGNLSNGAWNTFVHLSADLSDTRRALGVDPDDRGVVFLGIRMELELRSQEWRDDVPGGNIAQGRGFFGAVGRFIVPWILDTITVSQLGFIDGQG